MAKYLLDTTVLIDHLRGRRDVANLIISLARDGHLLGVCCINVAELFAGLSSHDQTRAIHLIDRLEYLDVSRDAAKEAGRLRFDCARRGVTLTTADALIAATAFHEDATLITANVRDFSIEKLRLMQQP